ncbi:MAG: pyrroline-5-carboxylate reductase [Rhodospirillaceae bacterium]|nr:pyrroline-5-carboxylate reductase [Alphaproteobacteria bacterium]MBR73063.1 pyrroline-5-carboxylate reductase [Rhodospirillaceae bacterium]|tara:strand:+ start:3067 stop:3327 length:261 start_codon:yes stop_codon:yes gene_type:complete
MPVNSRLLDDLTQVASSAIGSASGIRDELEAIIKRRLETIIADMDLVTREEFEAVKEMAKKAREEQENLSLKVVELEEYIKLISMK